MSKPGLKSDCAAETGVLRGLFQRRMPCADTEADLAATARAVARAKLGDRDAMGYLYLHYADNVFGYVASIVRDEHEAEDVTQQVFAKLMVVIPKYRPREVPFLAWVLTISRNVAIDHLRRRRAIPCEETQEPDAGQCVTDPLDAVTLRDALRSLPDEQREVVVLRHVVGLSPAEIAGRMGRTESSVHGLHHRGRGAMRAALMQVGAAPAVMAS